MAEKITKITKPPILDETGQLILNELGRIANKLSGTNKPTVYGFHVDDNESDPSARVAYLRDAVGATPAKMDYKNGLFNYSSWKDAFFMPRPCMLRSDGFVDYYLDPNDYSKKTDGTASDVANTAYNGNAMMEWGRDGKKIWVKREPDAAGYSVYISDERVDDEYHAWSFVNNQNKLVDHFYTPIYNGSVVDETMRSLSGQAIGFSLTAQAEVTAAKKNNKTDDVLWYTETWADRCLINDLLILIGKSMNSQGVFGQGFVSSNEAGMKAYKTGALDANGLFFGYNDGTHAVKVFGMENWWGMQRRRVAGYINNKGTEAIKLAYGTYDGSTAEGYNFDGTGYLAGDALPDGGWLKTAKEDKHGFHSMAVGGSASTYWCDYYYINKNAVYYVLCGASADYGSAAGAFGCNLNVDASSAGWSVGAALSCKPPA